MPISSPSTRTLPADGASTPGEDAKQRRLAGAARAEHRHDLAVPDRQREALERCRVAFGRRMDAEHVLELDRVHAAASAARSSGPAGEPGGGEDQQDRDHGVAGDGRGEEPGLDDEPERRLRLGRRCGHRDEREDERREHRPGRRAADEAEGADRAAPAAAGACGSSRVPRPGLPGRRARRARRAGRRRCRAAGRGARVRARAPRLRRAWRAHRGRAGPTRARPGPGRGR